MATTQVKTSPQTTAAAVTKSTTTTPKPTSTNGADLAKNVK